MTTKRKYLKGEAVEILPEFQDMGDSDYIWIVQEDEEKGRVTIAALNSELRLKPLHVVQTDWIKHKQ
jgi:hypothetical protein